MKCIYCLHKNTEVVNSREANGGLSTWRRRNCLSCGKVFTTTERGSSSNLFVIKSDKRRQRFVYEKLFVSIFSILSSMKNHDNGDDAMVSKDIAEIVIDNINNKIKHKDVRTSEIIVMVFRELMKIDKALADRYIYYSGYRRKVGTDLSII